MRTVLSVSIPAEISEELDKLAKSTGRTKSDIVKESLSLFIWDLKLKETQRNLNPKAKKMGIVSEEDVFRAIS